MIQNNNNTESTQPSTPVEKKSKRRGAFLFNALGLIVILALAIFGGYQSGLSIRKQTRAQTVNQQLGEQFQNALVDMQFGRYEIARQRLEWIIENDPDFPGAQEKLTEALVQINLQENYVPPTATPSLTPTPDFSGAQEAFARAQQLITAQDWGGALGALDELRKLDSSYQASQVDGMYYFALRNNGYSLITQHGNLEGGIYYLTLAERFGPLDVNANGIREGARVYIIGASFWELNWEQTLFYFSQARNWGNLWDGTMTATDRYWYASMRYGDELFAKGKLCEEGEAYFQYQNALTVAPLDKPAQSNYNQLMATCYPPTLDPNLIPTATPTLSGAATTEVPSNTPETPTETPVIPSP